MHAYPWLSMAPSKNLRISSSCWSKYTWTSTSVSDVGKPISCIVQSIAVRCRDRWFFRTHVSHTFSCCVKSLSDKRLPHSSHSLRSWHIRQYVPSHVIRQFLHRSIAVVTNDKSTLCPMFYTLCLRLWPLTAARNVDRFLVMMRRINSATQL